MRNNTDATTSNDTRNSAWIKRQTSSPQARRLYEQERLVAWITDAIAECMESTGVSKAELARHLGTSRARITQVLRGSQNVTLRTLADLAWACGMRASIALEPLRDGEYISQPVLLASSPRPRVVEIKQMPASMAGGSEVHQSERRLDRLAG